MYKAGRIYDVKGEKKIAISVNGKIKLISPKEISNFISGTGKARSDTIIDECILEEAGFDESSGRYYGTKLQIIDHASGGRHSYRIQMLKFYPLNGDEPDWHFAKNPIIVYSKEQLEKVKNFFDNSFTVSKAKNLPDKSERS